MIYCARSNSQICFAVHAQSFLFDKQLVPNTGAKFTANLPFSQLIVKAVDNSLCSVFRTVIRIIRWICNLVLLPLCFHLLRVKKSPPIFHGSGFFSVVLAPKFAGRSATIYALSSGSKSTVCVAANTRFASIEMFQPELFCNNSRDNFRTTAAFLRHPRPHWLA